MGDNRPTKQQLKSCSALLVVLSLFGIFWFHLYASRGGQTVSGPESARINASRFRAGNLVELQKRRVYRYSVIAGGAYTPEELARAKRTDRVVAAHYAHFEQPTFRPATKNLLVYVSYRKQDRVFWTKSRHLVPRGELLLVSGERMARARCGNQLADSPQGPTENDEPAEDVLGSPKVPLDNGPVLPIPPLAEGEESEVADLYVPGTTKAQLQPVLASPNGAPIGSGLLPSLGGVAFPVSRRGDVNPFAPGVSTVPTSGASLLTAIPSGSVSQDGSTFVPSIPSVASAVPEPNLSKILLLMGWSCLVLSRLRKSA